MDHIKELIDAVAGARREAYATAPRHSNDQLEAAMFVAMAVAFNDWCTEAAKEPETLAPQVENSIPPTVTEEELGPEKPAKKSKWKHDHD